MRVKRQEKISDIENKDLKLKKDPTYKWFTTLKAITTGKRLAFLIDNEYLIAEEIHFNVDHDKGRITLTPITREDNYPDAFITTYDVAVLNGIKVSDFPQKDNPNEVVKLLQVHEY